MTKDPAFLFYSKDFIVGVTGMTMEERGQYITLLCIQHQKGHLNEKTICLSLGFNSLSDMSPDLLSKFLVDKDGNYYNERLELEIESRLKYSKSRAANGSKGGRPKKESDENKPSENHMETICIPCENHIGNGNGNINEDDIESNYVGDSTAREAEIGRVIAYYQDGIGGMIPSKAVGEIPEYVDALSANVVIEAISRMIKAESGTWNYAKKILIDWRNAGVKSMADINRVESWKRKNKEHDKFVYGGEHGGDKEGESL